MGKRVWNTMSAPLAAFALGVVVSSLALFAGGKSPVQAFRQMADFGFTTNSLIFALNNALPGFISALAVAVGFKTNLFNIGIEGQYKLAAILAAGAAAKIAGPGWFAILAGTLVAIVVGSLYAGVAGVLRAYRNVNEVVSTIMLNLIAVSLIAVLLNWDKIAKIEGQVLRTPKLEGSRQFPAITVGQVEIWLWIIPAALLGLLYHVMINRSVFGFELRSSGVNPGAALTSGVNPKRMILTTMLISGGFAGLVGMPTLFQQEHYYEQGFPSGFGFAGIAVALVGRQKAGGMAIAAFLFSFIATSARGLTSPPLKGTAEVGTIMQGTMMLGAVIAYEVVRRRREAAAIQEAAALTASRAEAVPA